jgi:hypothetical protein
MYTSTNPTKNISHKLRLKFPDVHLFHRRKQFTNMWKSFKEKVPFWTRREHTAAIVCCLPSCKTVYVVSSNMGEMKYGPSTHLLYITILSNIPHFKPIKCIN